MNPEQELDLRGLRELLEKATPGPWMYEDDHEGSSMGWIGDHHATYPELFGTVLFDVCGDSAQQQINAEFVVAAVNALPALLSRTEQAEAERDEALAGVAQALKQNEGLQDLLKERDAEMARLRAAMQKAVDQIAHLYENRARLTLEVALDAELSHQGGKA